jgi:hypothetical protein
MTGKIPNISISDPTPKMKKDSHLPKIRQAYSIGFFTGGIPSGTALSLHSTFRHDRSLQYGRD